MTQALQNLDDRTREILVGKQSHLDRNWVRLVLVRQVARVRKAGENVCSRQPRVVRKNLALGLARGQQFQNELHRQAGAADHRLPSQNFGINDNALRPRHEFIITRQIEDRDFSATVSRRQGLLTAM